MMIPMVVESENKRESFDEVVDMFPRRSRRAQWNLKGSQCYLLLYRERCRRKDDMRF